MADDKRVDERCPSCGGSLKVVYPPEATELASLRVQLQGVIHTNQLNAEEIGVLREDCISLCKCAEAAEAENVRLRDALKACVHTMTFQANAAENGGGTGHISVALKERAGIVRAALEGK